MCVARDVCCDAPHRASIKTAAAGHSDTVSKSDVTSSRQFIRQLWAEGVNANEDVDHLIKELLSLSTLLLHSIAMQRSCMIIAIGDAVRFSSQLSTNGMLYMKNFYALNKIAMCMERCSIVYSYSISLGFTK